MSISEQTADIYDVFDRYNGYLRLIKMTDIGKTDPNASIVTESRQAHGFKRIIFTTSGTHDITRFHNPKTSGDVSLAGISQYDFNLLMKSGVDKGGTYTSVVGTFDPVEGEDMVLNVHGQHIVRSSPDAYTIEMYDTDFQNLVSSMRIDKVTGDYVFSGVDSGGKDTTFSIDLDTGITMKGTDSADKEFSVVIDKSTGDITLRADTYSIVISKDGNLTITATTLTMAIDDLIVNGNLEVKQTAQLNTSGGTTTVKGATTIQNTLDTTGKVQLEGTNIVSS